jgi:hypothetical protein
MNRFWDWIAGQIGVVVVMLIVITFLALGLIIGAHI